MFHTGTRKESSASMEHGVKVWNTESKYGTRGPCLEHGLTRIGIGVECRCLVSWTFNAQGQEEQQRRQGEKAVFHLVSGRVNT